MELESEIIIGLKETEKTHEKYETRPGLVITISGVSGTGKTRTGQELADVLGLEFIKVGATLRKEAETETGSDFINFYNRTINKDRDLDRKTIESFRIAQQTGKGFIIEGWLAGFHAYKEMERAYLENRDSTYLYRLCFVAGDDNSNVRFERVLDRHRRGDPTLTLEQIKTATKERFSSDLKNWWEAYPELSGINPWDVSEGRPARIFYNNVVDTENLTVHEVTGSIIDELVDAGLVAKLTDSNKTDLS